MVVANTYVSFFICPIERTAVAAVKGRDKKTPADVVEEVGGAEGRKMLVARTTHMQLGRFIFG